MNRTWTEVGAPLVGTRLEDGIELTQDTVAEIIDHLDWQEAHPGMDLPAVPGLGIAQCIRELRIPKVSHIAVSNELAPYGLYGIRGHYTNGHADVFVVDRGSDLIPVCSDFYPKETT